MLIEANEEEKDDYGIERTGTADCEVGTGAKLASWVYPAGPIPQADTGVWRAE